MLLTPAYTFPAISTVALATFTLTRLIGTPVIIVPFCSTLASMITSRDARILPVLPTEISAPSLILIMSHKESPRAWAPAVMALAADSPSKYALNWSLKFRVYIPVPSSASTCTRSALTVPLIRMFRAVSRRFIPIAEISAPSGMIRSFSPFALVSPSMRRLEKSIEDPSLPETTTFLRLWAEALIL